MVDVVPVLTAGVVIVVVLVVVQAVAFDLQAVAVVFLVELTMFFAVFAAWVFFECANVCEPGTTLAVAYVYGWPRPT